MRTQLQYGCPPDRLNQRNAEYQLGAISLNPRLGLGEEAQFEENLLELAPFLRSFARALSGNKEAAEELTQETLFRAWLARATFKPGTALKAWLCVILRNKFYSDARRAWREVAWDQESVNHVSVSRPEQVGAIDLSDTVRALRRLPDEQREALILVGAGGFSSKDAAEICNCAVSTMRSRVSRARQSLSAILESESPLPWGSRSPALRAADEIMAELAHLAVGSGRVGLHPEMRGRHAKEPP
jgi:RNA polymerase sigma-70 factor (ECF subfamily)